jgi:hypothetical protein
MNVSVYKWTLVSFFKDVSKTGMRDISDCVSLSFSNLKHRSDNTIELHSVVLCIGLFLTNP